MKKIDFTLWSDTAFFFVGSWLISLCILRYYRVTMWLAIILCTLIALCFSAGLFFLIYRNKKKKFLLKQDREEKEKLMLHLALSSTESNKKLFAPILEEQKTYLLFSMQPLSADTVAEKIRKSKNGEVFSIFCNTLSPEAKNLCDTFCISVVEGTEVYAKLKKKNLLPEKYLCGERKRRGVKEKIKLGFQKKNSRSFFFGGAALLILSLFSFFPLYYVISGCILTLTGLIVRIFGYA